MSQNDVWIGDMDSHYKYIARYNNDLAIALKDLGKIISNLKEKLNLKLKGTRHISYRIRSSFSGDANGVLIMSPA